MLVNGLILASLMGAMAAGAYVFVRRQTDFLDRISVAAQPVTLVIVVLFLLSFLVLNLRYELVYIWSAARLTPLVGLQFGYDLYYGPGSGPILNTIYGPLAYFPYLPVTLFSSPTNILIVGQLISFVLGLMPIGILLVREARVYALPRSHAAIGIALFSLVVLSPLNHLKFPAYMVFGVHADSPSLAFGTLACIFLYRRDKCPSNLAIVLSVLFATLATWAKQVEVGIFPALGFYLMIAYGAGALRRFIVSALVIGLAVSAILLAIFGAENMLFNILTLPSRHPWYSPLDVEYGLELIDILKSSWLIWLMLVTGLIFCFSNERYRPTGLSSLFREYPWIIFVLASIFMVPTSFLAAVKLGGTQSSFHFLYYLVIVGVLLLTSMGFRSVASLRPGVQRVLPYLSVAILAIVAWPQLGWLKQAGQIYDNSLEQAYLIARNNPGEVYFPWMPLSTLLADSRLHHYEYGVWDRQLAGFGPGSDAYRQNLPMNMQYVLYPSDITWVPSAFPKDNPPALQYLPECERTATFKETDSLVGEWKVWKCK